MIPVLLIVVPLLSGLAAFFIKQEKGVKTWALLSTVITLVVSLLGLTVLNKAANLHADVEWLPLLGSRFTVGLDGMGQVLCLLTAVAFPIILVATWNSSYKHANNFYAFMLLSQAGLMGVFLAYDALLFYFFWELALIPAYFLCSIWGGEKKNTCYFQVLRLYIHRFPADAGRYHLHLPAHA